MPTTRGPQTTTWVLEPHTRAKHELVRRYLGGWFPILSTYNGRVVFLDGFAGPGVYSQGEIGSPIIALETLLDHPRFEHFKCEFQFVFFEPELDRAKSLKDCLNSFKKERGGLPENVHYSIYESSFSKGGGQIIETLERQKAKLAPTFALIDPFGFADVPLQLIAKLLSFDKCEVFFNFMYDFINRFLTAGNVDQHLAELFGCNDYREVEGMSAKERRAYIHEIYARQLRAVAKFTHVQYFSMFRNDGHLVYSLFFGTRDLAGLRVMKDAMWKVDPGGGNKFHDKLAGQDVLFQDYVDASPLRSDLTRHFASRIATVEEIEEYTLINTPYSASHWNRLVLKPLEKAGLIEVVSSPRKRRFTFPSGTVVRFL